MSGSRFFAASIAPAASSWLEQTRSARVLSVFGGVCNLINDRGEVVAVVSPQMRNGPFHVVLEEPVSLSGLLYPYSLIAVSPHQICLDGTVVDARASTRWAPSPKWDELHALRGEITQRVLGLESWIRATATGGSLIDLQQQDRIDASMGGHSMLAMRAPASHLCAAVAEADLTAGEGAARRLAGSGRGLTPAGDDYIVGAMYAAWILHSPHVAAQIARALDAAAAPLTTSLSAACLNAAARGEAGESWHDLFAALGRTEPAATRTAIARLLMSGHTSGGDCLAGLNGPLKAWAEREMPECLSLTG